MFILYKLTFASGKLYIGQTTRRLQTRIAAHRRSVETGSMLAVHCAWRTHGEPVVEVIAEYSSQEELHNAEKAAIQELNTLSPNGYNLSLGGETAPSKSPIVAKKIGEKSKGRVLDKNARELISAASKAHWQDPEYVKKVRSSLLAAVTDEHRENASKRTKAMWDKRKEEGWTMPQSQREKLSKKTFSEETRRKMSEAAKARKRTPQSQETKDKIAAANRAYAMNNPEKMAERGKKISAVLRSASKTDDC